MRYGVYVPTFGEYDVDTLAREAEAAGWDGFFIWDHLVWTPHERQDLVDTTVALTAIALATERVPFGAPVTPLARRRPRKLAMETTTLDRLLRASGGALHPGLRLGAHGAQPAAAAAGGVDHPGTLKGACPWRPYRTSAPTSCCAASRPTATSR